MNDLAKQGYLKKFLTNHKPSVMGLLETKVIKDNADEIRRKTLGRFMVLDNYAEALRGRI